MSKPTATQIQRSLEQIRKHTQPPAVIDYRELEVGDRVRQGDVHFVDAVARAIPQSFWGRQVVKERTIYRPKET